MVSISSFLFIVLFLLEFKIRVYFLLNLFLAFRLEVRLLAALTETTSSWTYRLSFSALPGLKRTVLLALILIFLPV